MSDTNLLADFLDLEPFAAKVDRDPRTVRRWMNEPDGLPYTRIGNRILVHVPTQAEPATEPCAESGGVMPSSTARTWQRLADIKISVAGFGSVRVSNLLQQICVADTDPAVREQLLHELPNLATALAPLPPSDQEEIAARIADAIREACDQSAGGTA